MIKPITFPGQKVPVVSHGAIFQRLLIDGKLYARYISRWPIWWGCMWRKFNITIKN